MKYQRNFIFWSGNPEIPNIENKYPLYNKLIDVLILGLCGHAVSVLTA